RMPKLVVSAMDSATRSIPSRPRSSANSASFPGWFSINTEICCTYTKTPPFVSLSYALVQNALALALAARQASRRNQADGRVEPQDGGDVGGDELFRLFDMAHGVAHHLRRQLHADFQRIQVMPGADHHKELRRDARNGGQHA